MRAAEILDGAVEPPLACEDLYSVLARHQGELDRMMLEQGKQQVAKHSDKFRVYIYYMKYCHCMDHRSRLVQ